MKFLADENLDNNILRGLLRRKPDLDIVRVQDVGRTNFIVISNKFESYLKVANSFFYLK